MNREQLRAYIYDDSNGLKKVFQDKNGLLFEAYLIRKELIESGKFKENATANDSLAYFMLSFSRNGRELLGQGNDFGTYATLINNLSFNAAAYCQLLVNEKDTLKLNNSSFVNTFGTASANNLLLVFKTKKSVTDYTLLFEDIGFGTGNQKFLFRKKDIQHLNHIVLKN
jgi:hypothetical protein